MRLFATLWISALFLAGGSAAFAKAEGGELGNAFIPFESKIGRFALEYPKRWSMNDLSGAISFFEERSGSFFFVSTNLTGVRNLDQLREALTARFPQVSWESFELGELPGFKGEVGGVLQLYVMRPGGDCLQVKMKSAEGEKSNSELSYMLRSFRTL